MVKIGTIEKKLNSIEEKVNMIFKATKGILEILSGCDIEFVDNDEEIGFKKVEKREEPKEHEIEPTPLNIDYKFRTYIQ